MKQLGGYSDHRDKLDNFPSHSNLRMAALGANENPAR